MKWGLVLVGLVAVLATPVAAAGTVQFDYQGCAHPVTLTVTNADPKDVWRQLAGQVGFAVRVGTDAPDTTVDFSMSGSVIEVLTALARYTGAVLVASNDDGCLGARQARTVWLMSEGTATAPALLSLEEATPAPAPASTVAAPAEDATPRNVNADAPSVSPQRRGQMTVAERELERERRRQARRNRR